MKPLGADEPERRAMAALRGLDVPILDSDEAFAAAGALEEAYGSHGHWSARGHEIVAEAIRREIADRNWLRGD
jgi:hypothetical protein